jgi:small subunit ribosomal protein S17e
MGANKPVYIKRGAEEVLKRYGDRFTNDYDTNKKILEELLLIESMKLRNRIAGYITRKKRVPKTAEV